MKLWGGRFEKDTDSFANHFHSSISFDKRLFKQDIQGSIAHAKMLGKQDIIPLNDSEVIVKTLNEILGDIENGEITFDENAEDIHMNIEKILIQKIGDVGKKLHTGRSRNDQVALDMRLYVRSITVEISQLIKKLLETILVISKDNIETIMPGYTHLQPAQPITLAHHLLAYFEMFERDLTRLDNVYKSADHMPLGSGALATTTYPLDRDFVKDELGFEFLTLNSLDAVSDRDFCLDLLSTLSILMMHLSRFCEELIIWSTSEFKFIEIDDAYSTGSSIMPQKKNPDMAELIRGKTGRVYGDLMSLLTVMKGLPLAYNKDMQEDKECVFDAIDTVVMCLPVFTLMIATMKVNKEKMYKSAQNGFMNATDAADWLVKHNVAFRDAHEIIGKLVLYCIGNNKALDELSLSEYQNISDVFDDTIFKAISLDECVNARTVISGPAFENVKTMIALKEKNLLKN